MRLLIFLLLFGYLSSGAQNYEHRNKDYQDAADSIVMLFVGSEASKHVRLDSEQRVGPTRLVFYYVFTHPRLSGEKFPIVFALDSSRQLIVDKETHGLINALDFDDTKIVSRKRALKICQAQAKSIRKRSAALIWYHASVNYEYYAQPHDLSAVWCGRMIWKIDGRINFRGEIAEGSFYVDVLTGQVTRAFAVPWD